MKHLSHEILEEREGVDISTDNKDDLWIWDKLHWFYFPDLAERPASQDEHLKERILPSVDYNDHKPTYVYMNNGRMPELESINHTPETVEQLNKTGVTFYLNEPMCIYNVLKIGMGHTLTFYSEFKGKENPDYLRSDELDCIHDYIIRMDPESHEAQMRKIHEDRFEGYKKNDCCKSYFDTLIEYPCYKLPDDLHDRLENFHYRKEQLKMLKYWYGRPIIYFRKVNTDPEIKLTYDYHEYMKKQHVRAYEQVEREIQMRNKYNKKGAMGFNND